jgi:predicted GNAT family N-acyltransferase
MIFKKIYKSKIRGKKMLIFKWSKGLEAFDDAHFIRETVFIKEQGFDSEFDETDKIAYHLTVYIGEAPTAIATARLFSENKDKEYHIGRVAVLKEYRGFHYGEALMHEVIRKAAELGAASVVLGAQKQAEPFYAKLGFQAFGEEYLDQWCPHVNMISNI